MERALRDRVRQQEAVAELGLVMLRADLDTLLEKAVELVACTLDVEYCKLLELLPDGSAFLLRAGVGWKEGLVGRATVPAGTQSQRGYTLLTKEPVAVDDLRTETRFEGPQLLRDHGVVSGLSIVIDLPERPYGVIGGHTVQAHAGGIDFAPRPGCGTAFHVEIPARPPSLQRDPDTAPRG